MTTILAFSPDQRSVATPSRRENDDALFHVAKALEASFLAHMLTSAGLGRVPEWGGGGPGEEHFASFLVNEQARAMTEAGGIGLAERIFAAMTNESGSRE